MDVLQAAIDLTGRLDSYHKNRAILDKRSVQHNLNLANAMKKYKDTSDFSDMVKCSIAGDKLDVERTKLDRFDVYASNKLLQKYYDQMDNDPLPELYKFMNLEMSS
jgi:hypothetical protein